MGFVMERWTQPLGRSRLYTLLSKLVGVVLVIAGLLKAYQIQTVGAGAHEWFRGFGREVVVAEVVFGAWLLVGFYPVWTRWVTALVFLGLFNVALGQYLAGRASCGCMGEVSVRPVVMVLLDALVILAMVWAIPRESPPVSALSRYARRAAFALVVLAGGGWAASTRFEFPPAAGADNRPTTADDLAVFHEVVLPRIAENEAAVTSLEVETRETVVSYYLKDRPETYLLGRRYVCKDRHIRRDTLRERQGKQAVTGVIVLSGNRLVEYDPAQRFANVRETDDREFLMTLDFRTLALRPPVRGIAEWLSGVNVLSAQVEGSPPARTVRLVIERPGRDGRPPTHTVEILLEERTAFLPTRLEYRPHTGGARSSAEVRYVALKPPGPYLPAGGRFVFYRADGALSGEIEIEVTKPPVVNRPVPESEFDLQLPPGTRVGGNLSTRANVGKVAAPVSKVASATAPPKELPPRFGALGSQPWTVLGFNLAVLSACAGSRLFLSRRVARESAALNPHP